MHAYASSSRALALALAALFAACAADGGNGERGSTLQPAALMCAPGMPRACPCAGTETSTGMQTCEASGKAYGLCTGCPPALPSVAAPPTAGTSAQAGAGAAGAPAGSADAGTPNGDGAGDEAEPTLDQGGAVPGTSCGVGLPSLCADDTEKCCVRSLDTDICIAADAACECAASGCTVMEAYCDGPEDCADGEVCCGTLSMDSSGYDSFECATQCASTGNQRVACHKDASECPAGDVCANSQLLTNVQVCIDPATIEQ